MIIQGPYANRTIFESLDMAWNLLRGFPKELLKKIPDTYIETYYARRTMARKIAPDLPEATTTGAEEEKEE